jgi:signal transduction histidine kinase
VFIAEAITPIEQTHRAATESNIRLSQLNEGLSQRTTELATSNRDLKKEIARRQVVEANLRNSKQHTLQLLEESRLFQEQLRLLSRGVLSVQEEERKRISRELHDVIAQMLMGINVRLATLKTEATASTKGLTKSIAQTQRLVERSVDIVHQFACELRPAVLDDLGLIPALHSSLKTFSKKSGIRVSLTSFAGIESLSIAKRTALYRVAHEALSNVARHAHASRAEVTIRKLPNAVCMDISDNGRGFNTEPVLFASKPKRLGLLGIRERVEMLGGKFTVESAPGKGTTVHAQVPFNIDIKEHAHP